MLEEQNKAIVNRIWKETSNEGKLHLIDAVHISISNHHFPYYAEVRICR